MRGRHKGVNVARMRIARFVHNAAGASKPDRPQYAFVQTDSADGKDYLVALDGYPFGGTVAPSGERFPIDGDGIRLLAPVMPTKIYGVAGNYRAKDADNSGASAPAGSLSMPASTPSSTKLCLFMEPSSAIVGADDPVVIPAWSHDVAAFPQVAVVMGQVTRNVAPEAAVKRILGYMCATDMLAQDALREDLTCVRARGFDTSLALGPWIQTDFNPADAAISMTVNGENSAQAAGNVSGLIASIAQIISQISSFATLLPGDVILTGSPADFVGSNSGIAVHSRDELVTSVAGLGSLRNITVDA